METIMIVSGYFNPLHVGHLTMLEEGARRADKLVVIVNNDKQQLLKKGKVIINQDDRARVVRALRIVDDVVMSIDEDPPVINTLEKIATELYPNAKLIFGNGGDRNGARVVPETEICAKHNIQMFFDLGVAKDDSSTRINQALGRED